MNEFTRSLLYVALLVCVPIVTACIQKGIAVFIEFIVAKINDLKAAGTFNEAEQKEALMRAVSAALKSMSSDAQDYIKSNFGDTTQYLENRIEAQIDANHVAAKQAAAQNTLNLG